MPENSTEIKDLREYAWKYFSFHADQRLKTFHFFLILSTVALGGYLTALKEGLVILQWTISVMMLLMAFIFQKLDTRNKYLIKGSETLLKSLEMKSYAQGTSEQINNSIFLREEIETSERSTRISWYSLERDLRYSTCFKCLFIIYGLSPIIINAILMACPIIELHDKSTKSLPAKSAMK